MDSTGVLMSKSLETAGTKKEEEESKDQAATFRWNVGLLVQENFTRI